MVPLFLTDKDGLVVCHVEQVVVGKGWEGLRLFRSLPISRFNSKVMARLGVIEISGILQCHHLIQIYNSSILYASLEGRMNEQFQVKDTLERNAVLDEEFDKFMREVNEEQSEEQRKAEEEAEREARMRVRIFSYFLFIQYSYLDHS